MDIGNVCGLFLTVPWRSLEVVHERCKVLDGYDSSMYGARLGAIEEIEVLSFDRLNGEHVTKPYQTARTGETIDVWRLRGSSADPHGRGYSFILLEQHAALYDGVLTTIGRGGRPKSWSSQIGAASRLHGASGSGKSYAMMYILFRELARGNACLLLRRSGRSRLVYWLKGGAEKNFPEHAQESVAGGSTMDEEETRSSPVKFPSLGGHLVQISGFDGADDIEVQCLMQESSEADHVDWEPVALSRSSLDFLLGSLFVRRQDRYELSGRVRIGLLDGASPETYRSATYVPAMLITGHRYTSQTLNEWFWAGLSPVQIELCRQLCWKRFYGGEIVQYSPEAECPTVTGYSLFETAGVDLRLASVICFRDNAEWVQPPIEGVVCKMSLSELLGLLEVGLWTEDWAERPKANLVKCQLRPGAGHEWRFEPGNTCLPFMQRVITSELVRQVVLKRITWFPAAKLFHSSKKSRDPVVFSALLRQILYQRGLTLRGAPKPGYDFVGRVPNKLEFIFGATTEQILANYEGARRNLCYVNTDFSNFALVVKIPKPSRRMPTIPFTNVRRFPKGDRDFQLIGFTIPNGKRSRSCYDSWNVDEAEMTVVVHARLANDFSIPNAVQLIKASARPACHQVWLLEEHLTQFVISRDCVGPRIRWLLDKFIATVSCSRAFRG